MQRTHLAALAAGILLLAGPPALAINEGKFPFTLIDATCTDSYSVPAGGTPTEWRIGQLHVPTVQTTGTADGYCDHDAAIVSNTAYTADTAVGPWLYLPTAAPCLYADAVASNTDGDQKWRIAILRRRDIFADTDSVHATAEQTGDVAHDFQAGCRTTATASPIGTSLNLPLPVPFRFMVDLRGTTTTMTIRLGWGLAVP